MLQSMRDGAKSWLLKGIFLGLLTLATAGLVLMDMGGFFRDGAPTTIAFEIEGREFTTLELDRLVTEELRKNNLSLEQGLELGIVDSVIEREIQSRLLSLEARDLGIRISDQLVANQTRALINNMMQNAGSEAPIQSEAMQRAIFGRFLQSMGMSEGQYVAFQKNQIASTLMDRALFSHELEAEALVGNLLAYQGETRNASIHKVTVSDSELPSISEEELQAYYEENKGLYEVPEYRKFSVLTLTLEGLMSEMVLSDDLLREEYQNRLSYGDYQSPEMRRFSQASLSSQEQAEAVLEKAKANGGNLKKAVKDVTGGEEAFIARDDYQAAELPGDLGKAIFAYDDTGLAGPIEAGLGWFVVDIEKITPAKTRSFDSVKQEIEKDLKQDRAADMLFETAYAVEDLLAGGATLEEAAKEMNASVKRFDYYNKAARNFEDEDKRFNKDDIDGAEKILAAVFETEMGLSTQLLENDSGDFMIAWVDDVKPARIPEMDEIADELKADWRTEKRAELSRKKAEELMTAYREEDKKLNFKSYKNVPRLEETGQGNKSGLDDFAVAALFQLNEIDELASIPAENGQQIVRLDSITVPKATIDGSDNVELKGRFKRSFKNDLNRDYFAALRDQMNIDIHHQAIKRFYDNRLEQRF